MPQLLEKLSTQVLTRFDHKGKRKTDSHLPFLLVCLAFVSIAAVVSLSGEFPINDDYIYTWSVRHLLETGQFKIPGTVASSIFPIYAGAAACSLAGGFSYSVLRVVSFAFGLLGGVGLYCALRQVGLKSRESALGAAVYLLNPLFVNVCFGFMTDVPALAMNNWLLYFGLRLADSGIQPTSPGKIAIIQLKKLDWFALIGAVVVVTLAVASRQTVFAFLPCMLLLACRPRLSAASRFVLLAMLVCWPLAFYKMLEPIVLGACDYLTSYTGYKQFFADVLLSLVRSPATGIAVLAAQATKVLSYLGLFCLPLTVPLLVGAVAIRRSSLKIWLPVLFVSALALAFPFFSLLGKQCLMPMSENLFSPPAVGTYCIISGGIPGWSVASRTGLTYFSGAAAVVLLSLVSLLVLLPLRRFARAWHYSRSARGKAACAAPPFNAPVRKISGLLKQMTGTNTATCFLALATVCAIGSLIVQTTVMNLDRYYLFGLGPAILALLAIWGRLAARKLFWLGAALTTLMFAYSLFTAMDCMSFQRQRWQALNWLVERGTPPLQIDGGPEFNYGYNMRLCEGYRMDKDLVGWPDSCRGAHPRNQWRWWPISAEKFIVCGSKLDGYKVERTFSYFSPLKWRNRDIFVLKADETIAH